MPDHPAEDRVYLIWSFEHKAWWKPERQGYTNDHALAGRYTAFEAGDIVISSIWLDEVAIHERVLEHHGFYSPLYHPYRGE